LVTVLSAFDGNIEAWNNFKNGCHLASPSMTWSPSGAPGFASVDPPLAKRLPSLAHLWSSQYS
jgi:hypothetical protein